MSTSNNQYETCDQEAIEAFREYLRIPSVEPNVNYDPCVDFLRKQAHNIELPCEIYSAVEGKPVVIITWLGTQPELPAIMLSSHMDVVPVNEDMWTYKPFGAEMDERGNIYGRGSQDMKCVGIQYIEAVKRLKKDGVKLKRTVHICFVPDEEIGGEDGMGKFVHSNYFKSLNIEVAFDEGVANPGDEFVLFYGERSIWIFEVHCSGAAGHGAGLSDNTAGEKIQYMINKLLDYREAEKKKLKDNPNLTLSDVIGINMTKLGGGTQPNVLPAELTATFDCRVPITVNHKEWQDTLERWCKEAGEGVWIEYEVKQPPVPITRLDASNPYWIAFKSVANEMGIKLLQMVCPGSTDAKFIRRVGLPAFGFSPMNHTPLLLHDHNEYLNVKVFLKGIEIYCRIIEKIANLN